MNQLPERQSNSKEGLKTNPGHLESNIQQTNLQGTPSFQSNKYVEVICDIVVDFWERIC